jgi:hypothetical protein
MLSLLRKIQKEKFFSVGLRKYLTYAIGEIALVVLGMRMNETALRRCDDIRIGIF